MKYLAMVFLLLFPSCLFSQQLEPNDIDVYITRYDEIMTVFYYLDDHGFVKEEWVNYDRRLEDYSEVLERIWYGHFTESNLDFFRELYNNFIDITPPESLENTFKSIGWTSNGQRKFAIIRFITDYFMLREYTGSEEKDSYSRLLQICDERDVHIVENRINDIRRSLSKWY